MVAIGAPPGHVQEEIEFAGAGQCVGAADGREAREASSQLPVLHQESHAYRIALERQSCRQRLPGRGDVLAVGDVPAILGQTCQTLLHGVQ